MLGTISLVISGLSLGIAFLNYKRNSPKIIQILPVDRIETRFAIPKGSIYYYDDEGNKNLLGRGFMVRFNFLNPSSKDIAYFHCSFYVEDHIKEIYTNRTVAWNSTEPTFIWNRGDKSAEIPFLENATGTFKANSLTPVYAYISLPENESIPNEIKFSIKVATRRFPYLTTRQQYREISYAYSLDGFEVELTIVESKLKHDGDKQNNTAAMLNRKSELQKKASEGKETKRK